MKPLFVLIISFVILLFGLKLNDGYYSFQLSGRIAMSIMLIFTSVAHFKFVRGMTMMVPQTIPFKKQIVYLTGIIEILIAIGLPFDDLKMITGWALIIFFAVLLPANINAALKKIDYENGTFNGKGKSYLWFRVPLQVFFIAWIYFSAIH